MNTSPFKIAQLGERIVHQLLPGSEWKNPLIESGEYYDILWQGIKINAKTTRYRLKNGFQCSMSWSQTGKQDVVFVVVGIEGKKNYFWVVAAPKATSTYIKFSDCVPLDKIKERIKEVANEMV